MKFDERGRALPDATPVEVPAGFRKPESLEQMVRRFIRTGLSQHAGSKDMETFEESMDFEVDDDDMEPMTQAEYRDMMAEIPAEDREVFEKWRKKHREKDRRKKPVSVHGANGGDDGETEEDESAEEEDDLD